MANTTGKKFGGREAGTPNKRNLRIAELAEQHDADPALFLIMIMKGDRRTFGYEDRIITRERNHELEREAYNEAMADKVDKGKKVEPFPELRELEPSEIAEINLFDSDTRLEAAKELMPYLYGKRKPIDSDGDDSTDILGVILEAIDGNK